MTQVYFSHDVSGLKYLSKIASISVILNVGRGLKFNFQLNGTVFSRFSFVVFVM